MLADNLESCCLGLDSCKVTERRKCAENLKEYLDRSEILSILNLKKTRCNWDFVYISTHRYIKKESEKLNQDELKQICTSANYITRIKSYSELLKSVLSKALLGGSNIKVAMIIDTCLECFNSVTLKKFFGDVYISILIKYVLSIPQHFVKIGNEKWKCMFLSLKQLYKNPFAIEKHNILHAVHLTIKNGVVHSALNLDIRSEFSFLREICLSLKDKSNSQLNDEIILKLLTVFSAEVSVECRMASCKLGEEIGRMLVEMLYCNVGSKKNLIFDYFLLQMSVHHPFGAEPNSDAAYAFNWDVWKPLMNYLYSALCNEVESILRRRRLNTENENIPTLEPNFLQLFVDVAKQVFRGGVLDVTQQISMDCSLSVSKKPRLEIGVPALIGAIQGPGKDNKWAWLCILSRLIYCYPETIESSQFLPLLETSASMQAESKCYVTRHYLYELLTHLVTLQDKLNAEDLDFERVKALWHRIWETSLRSAGLNQNEQSTHKHLQTMLQHYKTAHPLTLLPLYGSGVLNLTKYSLETFFTLCTMDTIPETFKQNAELNIRQYMIKNIITNKSGLFETNITEKTLVGLVMKMWPYKQCNVINTHNDDIIRQYKSIEDCFKITAFDKGLLFHETNSQTTKVQCPDKPNILVYSEEIFKQLLQQLDSFILNLLTSNPNSCAQIIELINTTIFITRVFSELIIEGLLPAENVTSNQKFRNLLSKLCTTLQTPKYFEDLSVLEAFESLLKLELHSAVALTVRDEISVKFLHVCFDFWNSDEVDGSDDMDIMDQENSNPISNMALNISSLNTKMNEKSLMPSERTKLTVIRILVHYSCVPEVDIVKQSQKDVIESLLLTDIDPLSNIDFQAMVYLMNGLTSCKVGLLTNKNINSMLNILQPLIESRFQEYEASIVLLQILKEFIPHVNISTTNEFKSKLLSLLFIFFDNSKLYRPLVCIKIADCCGELFKKLHSMLNVVDVATKLLELLNYGSHEVRLAVIINIVLAFRVNSDTTTELLKQQDDILSNLNQKVEESFTLNYAENTCQELLIDEAANRTASALHMYSSLIVASPFWRKKTLLFLMYFVAYKQIKTEYLHKVLTIVGEYLNVKNVSVFLNDHLDYLINQWSKSTKRISEFPYLLFGCETLTEFFKNNLQSVITVLFETQRDGLLENLCKELNRSVTDVLMEFYPNLIVQYIPICLLANSSVTHQLTTNDIKRNENLFKQLNDVTNSDGRFTLLSERLDNVLIQLLYRFFDSDHFQKQFGYVSVLPEADRPFYNHELLFLTVQFIESKVLNGVSIIAHCMNKSPNKLERVIFHLTRNLLTVTETSLEEKLLSLHRYSILVDYIIPQLESVNEMSTFLIRSITSNLISVIQLNFNETETELLSIAACRYFKIFITNSLPFNTKIFEKLLICVVSTLVPIAKLSKVSSEECLDILRLLLVTNSKHLYAGISALDPFPNDVHDQKFAEIQATYEKCKYGNENYTLEQEIRHFLRVGHALDLCDRTEGLSHLKKELSRKKTELFELYSRLNEENGGNHERSILHQLICMLVDLTKSPISEVRIEAARCLGELGPSDLTTLVLKAENPLPKTDMDPLEIVTGEILVLLTRYLFLPDVDVISTVTDALYSIINSETGIFLANNRTTSVFSNGILEQHYIFPFLMKPAKASPTYSNFNDKQFRLNLDDYNIWRPVTNTSHSEWITTFVCKLLESFSANHCFRTLLAVCRVQVQFAEKILPLIVFLIIMNPKKNCIEIITRQMNGFFEKHWRGTTIEKHSCNLMNVVFNQESVQCMLNVVHYVRLQLNHFQINISKILKLNFLYVAQAAQFCGAHFTSILYAELWCYSQLEEKPYNIENKSPVLEVVCDGQSFELTFAFEKLLREGYKKIGDMDAVYGCGKSYILNTKSRIEYYKNTSRWDKVLLFHNKDSEQMLAVDLTKSLKHNGLHWLASKIPSEDVNLQFECAWRLSNWTFSSNNDDNTFERNHFQALKLQQEQDFVGMDLNIREARNAILKSISHASLETSKSLYRALSNLRMLQDIENFAKTRVSQQENKNLHELLISWRDDTDLIRNEFEYIEPIKAQRITMLKDSTVQNHFQEARGLLVDFYLKLATESRIELSYHHVAQQCLDNASGVEGLSEEMRGKLLFEQAQLSWLDDKTSGRYLLKYLLDNNKSVPLLLHGMALNLYGNWMVETQSENPTSIIENYFVKSIRVLEVAVRDQSVKDTEVLCDAINSLARFADQQYQKVQSYIESSGFQSKKEIIDKFRSMASKIKSAENTKDEARAIAMYERQSKIDESEVNCTHKERETYLTLAVENYFRILKYSDSYNLQLFRIFSISLENKTNRNLLTILEEILPQIASYKYIPLLPQLVPHIGNSNTQIDTFETNIQSVLERCSLDHPHHTLPIILALADSYKDRNYDSNANQETVEKRVQLAKELITRLKKKKPLTKIIENMEEISTALVSLAYVDASKCSKSARGYTVPRNEPIKTIRNFDNVLLPTMNLTVRKNCIYTGIVGVQQFSLNFSLVGGINAPKRIVCCGTDGIQRTQLVKGKDDLRQDAVMQQVFFILNKLLSRNQQTQKLLIRTYKVVPLSQRSGVLEWCENTEPLGTYLMEAHKEYHPNEWSTNQCRAHLRSFHSKDHESKYRAFKEICANFRPIFHMFFISSYPQPTEWFERRRAYMHSVATSSMVGYILGLGDRHVQNILLDKNTAEVIHIDFGIAFEQGKCLPTPETVPFRLTRDIEAGMGICGIEGVFRRSCEKTMHVLRQNAETLVTILQVLLYDPLYVWTITPSEAYSRQKDDDDRSINFSDEDTSHVNTTAERVLLRLREKLQGMENGAICSVEGQVELLVQQARDPVNLSRLFNGWQPYL